MLRCAMRLVIAVCVCDDERERARAREVRAPVFGLRRQRRAPLVVPSPPLSTQPRSLSHQHQPPPAHHTRSCLPPPPTLPRPSSRRPATARPPPLPRRASSTRSRRPCRPPSTTSATRCVSVHSTGLGELHACTRRAGRGKEGAGGRTSTATTSMRGQGAGCSTAGQGSAALDHSLGALGTRTAARRARRRRRRLSRRPQRAHASPPLAQHALTLASLALRPQVFVGNLPFSVNDDSIKDIFAKVGQVSVLVSPPPPSLAPSLPSPTSSSPARPHAPRSSTVADVATAPPAAPTPRSSTAARGLSGASPRPLLSMRCSSPRASVQRFLLQ